MPGFLRKGSLPPVLGLGSRWPVFVVVLLLVAVTTGCASDSSSPVVLRVGSTAIDRATIDHWSRAISLGSTIDSAFGQPNSTPRQKALDFLISANWAIGEAARRGLAVSDGAVAQGLKERIAAVPDGRAGFEEEIGATGQDIADVELEIKAALASARLRQLLSERVPPVTQAQMAAYYKRHPQDFRIPDRRWVDLIESIHGYAHAVELGRRLGPGKRFAKRGLHELVVRQTPAEAAHRENSQLVRAIFAATPGRVAKPVTFNHAWVLIVVRKLVPASTKPLSEVEAEISKRLSQERHRPALSRFLEEYRRHWTAKTKCAAGFVVQKCSEYRGRVAPEGNLLAGG